MTNPELIAELQKFLAKFPIEWTVLHPLESQTTVDTEDIMVLMRLNQNLIDATPDALLLEAEKISLQSRLTSAKALIEEMMEVIKDIPWFQGSLANWLQRSKELGGEK